MQRQQSPIRQKATTTKRLCRLTPMADYAGTAVCYRSKLADVGQFHILLFVCGHSE
jgi:hypothetical protein